MIQSTEKDKRLEENLLPFTPLSLQLKTRMWTAGKEEVTTAESKKVMYVLYPPKDKAVALRPEETSLPNSDFSVRVIDKNEIKEGKISLPDDTWNLDNFRATSLRIDGSYRFTSLPAVESYYRTLAGSNPRIERSQICFSIKTKQIIILPYTL